jgi:hypothetical protein
MAQKKLARKKATKTSGKKSSKKSVSKPQKKASKAGVKTKPPRAAAKKTATAAKKSSSKKFAAKINKPAKLQKSFAKKGETKKALSRSAGQAKKTSVTSASSRQSVRTSSSELTANERYNLGGLFVCAIERANDPEFKRLRAVLRHLDLPSQEKDNLLRLSQGFTIPKLFADGVEEHKVSQILTDVIRFALVEGAYEKKWRDEIRQVGLWLGFYPQQVEQIEQKVLAKR